MKLNQSAIQKEAKQLLDQNPDGLRWSEILRRIREQNPQTPPNTIRGATFSLFRDDGSIVKVSRGFYRLACYETGDRELNSISNVQEEIIAVEVCRDGQGAVSLRESDFYQPFADWLRDELNEVTEAVALGGALFRSKWGTPDVIGVLKPQASDLIKFAPRIVSAELKIDPSQPIVAFGQAVAYRLFSHKSYIVVPSSILDPDYDRLVALCTIYGLGLVTFDLDVDEPNFNLRVNALQSEPDMLYVNEMARQFSEGARNQFNRLF